MSAHVLVSRQLPHVSRQASRVAIPRDVLVVCLWSACGLALSTLFVLAGLGPEITQALAAG